MHANQREEIKEVLAGDIAACVGLKDVTTGETLCDPDAIITLERMVFPEPVISQAVEPKTKADQEKMGIALSRLAQEDPSFRVRTDEESGQTIISGMGELHLEIIVDRMKREFGVEANVGKPQVAYRETIRKTVSTVEGKFVKQSGGAVSTVTSCSRSSRTKPGKGFEFVDAIKGGVVPREYIPAVEKGVSKTAAQRRAGRLSRWWTSRSRCSSVPTTTWTRTKTPSRWPRSMASRTAAQGQPGDAGADDGGRSRDAGRLHG